MIRVVACGPAVDQQRRAVDVLEEQVVLDRLRREGEPYLRLVEGLAPLQVRRDEYRRNPVVREHVFASLPVQSGGVTTAAAWTRRSRSLGEETRIRPRSLPACGASECRRGTAPNSLWIRARPRWSTRPAMRRLRGRSDRRGARSAGAPLPSMPCSSPRCRRGNDG